MLNKEMLLAGGQQKNDGIWEITVGAWDNFCGKCIAANREDSGKMVCLDKQNPDLIFGTNNEYFEHQNYFILRSTFVGMLNDYLGFPKVHKPNLSDTTIYIHLKKGSDVISKSAYMDLNRSNTEEIYPSTPTLFNEEDIGKTYRIYMGPLATPPPVALTHCVSSNSFQMRRIA